MILQSKKMPKRSLHKVRGVFNSISHRYDLMNSIMTFGLMGYTRYGAVNLAFREKMPNLILDLSTGTGELALALRKKTTNPVQIFGIDISREMLKLAEEKEKKERAGCSDIRFLEGDILRLPFKDNTFDLVTIAYGIRNVEDTDRALSEAIRVTRGGGVFVCLETSRPRSNFWRRLQRMHFSTLVPMLSGIIQGSKQVSAYRYLNETIDGFLDPKYFAYRMKKAGWRHIEACSLLKGMVTIHRGIKRDLSHGRS